MATDVDAHVSRIETDGWTIVEDAIDPAFIDALLDDVDRLETSLDIVPAGNTFEGARTTRVYNLLAHGHPWTDVATHNATLPVIEQVLGAGCLISSLSAISIQPGEVAQPIHADDQVMPIAKPHTPTVCNTMWALTDFTEANGATRIVPGSHHYDHNPPYGEPQETVPALMPKGSVLIWPGGLWHGGGANTTDERRVGIAMNYCAGWIRQQENQQLGIPTEMMATFSPKLRDLCGLGVYRGLMGHIDKQSPATRFYGDDPSANLWDKRPL